MIFGIAENVEECQVMDDLRTRWDKMQFFNLLASLLTDGQAVGNRLWFCILHAVKILTLIFFARMSS